MNEQFVLELQKLLNCFPDSYINRNLEVILIPNMEYQLKVVKLLGEMSAGLEFFIDNITQTKMNQSKVLSYYNEKIGMALERENK